MAITAPLSQSVQAMALVCGITDHGVGYKLVETRLDGPLPVALLIHSERVLTREEAHAEIVAMSGTDPADLL
jgi:hypothetical protein